MPDLSIIHIGLMLFAFGSIIFVHELGHYLAARRVGVRVEKFYIGMDFWGLKLFSFMHKGTEYGIGVFPIGGYVKLAGQEDFGKADVAGKPDEFTSKSIWERVQILAAGVIFNFISAFAFSALAVGFGYRIMAPLVGGVESGSAAWYAGIQEGDRILDYNDHPIRAFSHISVETALGGDHPSIIRVERGGQTLDLPIQPVKNERGIAMLGLEPALSLRIKTLEDSPAHRAGLLTEDVITHLDDQPISRFAELLPLVEAAGKENRSVRVRVLRAGQSMEVDVLPEAKEFGELGILPKRIFTIKDVRQDTVAQRGGFRPGQVPLSINGRSLNELDTRLWRDELKAPLAIAVRDTSGAEKVLTYPGDYKAWMNEVHIVEDSRGVEVLALQPDSTGAAMGLKIGDVIQSVEIIPPNPADTKTSKAPIRSDITSWNVFEYYVGSFPGGHIALQVFRNEKLITVEGDIGIKDQKRYLIGVGSLEVVIDVDWGSVAEWPFEMLHMTYRSIFALFSNDIDSRNMSGPIGISRMAYLVSETGLANLFYFMALISINLAFINILPIPVLDGGHILLCIVEALKGRPLNEKAMNAIQYAGLVLILTLFVFVTYNDISDIIERFKERG